MKAGKQKLTFEPSIFRDWTVMYCSIVHKVFTVGFEKEIGWHYTDVMFAWDGAKVTIYRAIEEHVNGFYDAVEDHIRTMPDFLLYVAKNVIKEVNEAEPFWRGLSEDDLTKLTNTQLMEKFKQLDHSSQTIIPWFLILMYFPQQLEVLGITKYDKYLGEVLDARGKVDKILAPLSNKATLSLSSEALKRSGIDEQYARYLAIDEFSELLSRNDTTAYASDLLDDLEKRKGYFLVAANGVSHETPQQYTQKHCWDLQLPESDDHLTQITGKSAYIAKRLTGEVVVVPNPRAIDKIKAGVILVAPMTTPEYGPIFHLVKAIITDEGGITCHAAIIAREMKIPTIIGTKVASTLLKDGDKVEVDTEKATVRILK